MKYEISGKIIEIYETQDITASFKKREFVIEHREETGEREFINYIKFQAIQERCQLLDSLNLNDRVKVSFSLKGRKWEKAGQVSYFTNLEAWKIESAAESIPSIPPPDTTINDLPPLPENYNDLPF
ncbi:MAG: DUF3127 domain-containing protein [Candidatus Dojkabacteria bacterium]|jgi:hypothetical protein